MINRNKNLYTVLVVSLILSMFVLFLVLKKDKHNLVISTGVEPIATTTVKQRFTPVVHSHKPLTASACGDMKKEKEKKLCLDKLKLKEDIETENAKLCLTLTEKSNRDECLLYIATKFQLDNICQAIADSGQRAVCLDRITIDTKDKKRCGTNFKNEPHEIAECVDRIRAFEVIDGNLDLEECDKIKTLEYPNLCLRGLYKNKYKGNCENVPSKYRDYCVSYYALSSATKQEDCSKIPLKDYKEYCLLKVKTSGDPSEISRIDSDNDKLSDYDELFTKTDPHNKDTDNDGLKDWDEIFKYNTNPSKVDSDGDGIWDGDEVKNGTDPTKFDSDDDGIWDGDDNDSFSGDTDHDGLKDEYEKIIGTDPNNPDSDGDGMSDGKEFFSLRDPLGDNWQMDSDHDGLIDIDEAFYKTNRLVKDSDNDGIWDGEEVKNLTNPMGEGDMDYDGDGLTDKEELKYKTNPTKIDTNDDGISDYDSVKQGIDPLLLDSDGDGIDNYREKMLGYDLLDPDMDDDGLSDGDEVNKYYTNPKKADTDNDGYNDGVEVKNNRNPRGE